MELKIIKEQQVLGRNFVVYGSVENPLFKAKDIAEWLDLTNVTDMISRVDSDEVTKLNLGGLQGEYARFCVFEINSENLNTPKMVYLCKCSKCRKDWSKVRIIKKRLKICNF